MNLNVSSNNPVPHARTSRLTQTVRLLLGRPLITSKERARLELAELNEVMLSTEARTFGLFIESHRQAMAGDQEKARELRGFGEEFWASACNLEELYHQKMAAARRDGEAQRPARTLSLRELDELVRCAERTSVRVALENFTTGQGADADLRFDRAGLSQSARRQYRGMFREELGQSPLCRPQSKMSWDTHARRPQTPRPPHPIARFESLARASREERSTMTWIDLMADAALLATRKPQ